MPGGPLGASHLPSARVFASFWLSGSLVTAQRWSRRWTRGTLVPMNASMSETAAIQDTAEAELHPSMRERLGIAAFVLVAVVATATWIVLLVWAVVQLVKHI